MAVRHSRSDRHSRKLGTMKENLLYKRRMIFCYNNKTPKSILLLQHSSDLGYFGTLLFGSGSLKNMVSRSGLCHWAPFGSIFMGRRATFFSPRVLDKCLNSQKRIPVLPPFRLTLKEFGSALNQPVYRTL